MASRESAREVVPRRQWQIASSSASSDELVATRSKGDDQRSGAASLSESGDIESVSLEVNFRRKRTASEMINDDEQNLTRTEPNLEDILLAGKKPHLTPPHRSALAKQSSFKTPPFHT